MSFPDAVAEASAVMKLRKDFDFALDQIKAGRSYPKEMLSMGTKPVMKAEGGQWVQLTDPKAAAVEGALMKHSIAGYYRPGESYGVGGRKGLEEGRAQLFSFRGQKDLPQVTIEGEKLENGDLVLKQIKGPYNSFPAAQKEQIFQFIDKRPDIIKIPSENYSKTAGGEPLDESIPVNWAKEFSDWKLRQ
jgi:hypothetical protein